MLPVAREPRRELHQRIDVKSLQSVAMLEMPIAGRFSVEQVAAESLQRLFERRDSSFLLPLQHFPRRRELAFELRNVELADDRRIDHVSLVRQHDPFTISERLAETVQGDVKAVAQLSRRCLWPKREANLLFGAPFRVHHEVDE